MSEKDQTSRKTPSKAPKPTREERLAEQLRANLRRRKQAARKTKTVPSDPSPKP